MQLIPEQNCNSAGKTPQRVEKNFLKNLNQQKTHPTQTKNKVYALQIYLTLEKNAIPNAA